MAIEDLFFELLQVSLNRRERLSHIPTDREWEILYSMCQMQAVVGMMVPALDSLSRQGQKPNLDILLDWIGFGGQIKQQNMIVNRDAVDLCRKLQEDGFDCCILKGQGNNLLYPNPWLRNPGDVDVWIKTVVCGKKIEIRDIIKYVKGRNPNGNAMYHHIDYGLFQETEVEVHYRPSFMFNPLHNRRIQRWFVDHAEEQFLNKAELPDGTGMVCVPTPEFNVIFQLSHVYNHLLHEGIGLRQIVDYYYVLKAITDSTNHKDLYKTLRYLGMGKIAKAMMWMMHEKLGLEDKYLIAPMDEKHGKALLAEIMRGGNFGFYDNENQNANSRIRKNIQRVRRDLRIMKYFPSECLWEPVFRVYHFFWRMRYNSKSLLC